MSEIVKRPRPTWLLWPLLFVLILGAILYGRSGTRLLITLSAADGGGLAPRVYWSKPGTPFSETRAASAFEVRNGVYAIPVPEKGWQILRLDPDIHTKRHIMLHAIALERRTLLHRTIQRFDLATVRPGFQIADFVRQKGQITFRTTGRDPQLIVPLRLSPPVASTALAPTDLVWSLFATLLIAFIIYLARHPDDEERDTAKTILYALFLFFLIFQAWYYAVHLHPGYPPDEVPHARYVAYVHAHHAFVPHFETMPHYLSHPPLYYELAALGYDDTLSLTQNLLQLRHTSIALFALTVLLTLALGYRMRVSLLGHFVFLTFLSAIPMYGYLGGSVSNDVLAMLAGVVFLHVLQRLLHERYDLGSALGLAFAVWLAYFSKFTVALLLFFALLAWVVPILKTRRALPFDRIFWAVLLIAAIPILYYQGTIFLRYHALIPTYNLTHPEAYLHSGFYTPPQYRLHLSLSEWFQRLLHYILGGWFGIHSHHSFGHDTWGGVWSALALHAMAFAAFLLPCRDTDRILCRLGKITLFALLAVLTIQFFFSYKAHLKQGYLGGLQPRYLLPFMVAFAILAADFADRFRHRFLWRIAIISLGIHAIYNNFFYMLIYYR